MTWNSANGSDRSLRLQESCSALWRRRGPYWPEWSSQPGVSVVLHILSTPQQITKSLKGLSQSDGSVKFRATVWNTTTNFLQVWGISPKEVVFREALWSGRLWVTHSSPEDHHWQVQSEWSGECNHGNATQVPWLWIFPFALTCQSRIVENQGSRNKLKSLTKVIKGLFTELLE